MLLTVEVHQVVGLEAARVSLMLAIMKQEEVVAASLQYIWRHLHQPQSLILTN